MSNFWSLWIIILTLGNIAACFWLIRWVGKPSPGESTEGSVTGHSWDGLEEYNNPLPKWWLYLFYITIAFGLGYLALYPGLGKFAGLLNWTETSQYDAEVAAADAQYGPLFEQYAATDIPTLAKNEQAMEMGNRLFLTYCSQCHGSDAGGAKGFPNLTDDDWLWGGTPEQIEQTILQGRYAMMPSHLPMIGEKGIKPVTQYVLSLSGRDHDEALAAEGATKFNSFCFACHKADGTGNEALGAPNLTDNTWLYGGSASAIEQSIRDGRAGQMPAQKGLLGEHKVHVLAAYVYSLSNKEAE